MHEVDLGMDKRFSAFTPSIMIWESEQGDTNFKGFREMLQAQSNSVLLRTPENRLPSTLTARKSVRFYCSVLQLRRALPKESSGGTCDFGRTPSALPRSFRILDNSSSSDEIRSDRPCNTSGTCKAKKNEPLSSKS